MLRSNSASTAVGDRKHVLPHEPNQRPQKEDILKTISSSETSALRKYQDFFVGRRGLWCLEKYEFITCVVSPLLGAPGYFLRKYLVPQHMNRVGKNVNWGRNITLRHPAKLPCDIQPKWKLATVLPLTTSPCSTRGVPRAANTRSVTTS